MKILLTTYYNQANTNNSTFKGGRSYEDIAKIIKNGNLHELQKLQSLNSCNKNGRNLLHEAITANKIEFIEYLSNFISSNKSDLNGITPFHLAIQSGNFDITKFLMLKDADIDKPDDNGETPLHKAINNFPIFKYLLDLGANPNVRDSFGIAPLHIDYKNVETINLLKEHGANLNIKDCSGRTIMHYAVEEDNLDLIKKYLELNIDINSVDNYNQSPIFLTKNQDTLNLLLSNNVNPNIQDIKGETVLHKAVRKKDLELIRFLLDSGVDVNIENSQGLAPFDLDKEIEKEIYKGLGKVIGMDELKQTLRKMVIEPFTKVEKYKKYKRTPANGILLHGLPGCGKTFIANALAEECGRNFYQIKPNELDSSYYGRATKKIKEVFEAARNNPPSIIFIDEMESIAPKRSHVDSPIAQDNNERIAELLQQMNNLSKDGIFVIGATNNPEMIDDAVKRAGRLDKSVFVPLPDKKARMGMFAQQLRELPSDKGINLELLAQKTENYTAPEIKNIVDTATDVAMDEDRNITMDDLLKSIKKVRPQNTKANIERYKKKIGLSELPEQKAEIDENKIRGFAKVAGMNDLKQILYNDVIMPLKNISLYKKYGRTTASGILLYGPPGTGKTFISEALAEESDRHIIYMKASSVGSPYQNETVLNIRKVFEEAEYNAPSIVFIDEIETLAPKRSNLDGTAVAVDIQRQISELLQQLNNCVERGIFVIAATNEPQRVDEAIRRVGRFDKTIFVPPPDFEARKELFRIELEKTFADKDIDIDKLAQLTKNYTAGEIQNVIIKNAIDNVMKYNKAVSENDLIREIKNYKPALTTEIIEKYRQKI